MQKLEGGKRVGSRGRVTNSLTYVLASLAVLVGTFSAGAWVGRDNAPACGSSTGNNAAALSALAGASGATGGFAGRNGGAGFSGASGFTGAPGGAVGAGGTTGTVKLVDGSNVYITTAQGTTVKVTTNAQSTVNVSKQGTVAAPAPQPRQARAPAADLLHAPRACGVDLGVLEVLHEQR